MLIGGKLAWGLGAGAVALAIGYKAMLWKSEPTANGEALDPPVQSSPATASASVETVFPTVGGLPRRTTQPGSAHSFESAELYAKVSGYLQAQHVDIGSRVKRGDLLAEIDVPELAKDVDSAEASWQESLAEISQAEASVQSAIADQKSAEARIAQSDAEVDRSKSDVTMNQKQYDRIRSLNGLKGIEDRIVDEKLNQLQAAQAGERAAASAVVAAKQQAAAAEAKVALAKADLQVAQAKSRVAQTRLERAKVMASYTKILSPYDGVVTVRNFHRGAYVRAPDQGGQTPLLSVDRIDMMRFVVQIPEREVPFVQADDLVKIAFDALPKSDFAGKIARVSHTQTPQTRSMLVEVDLPNPDGRIRDHMFGRAEIELEAAPLGVTVPSACMVGDSAGGKSQLFVLQGDHVRLRSVQIGKDSGVAVEILSGLGVEDEVVVRPPGGLVDGAAAVANRATKSPGQVSSAERQTQR